MKNGQLEIGESIDANLTAGGKTLAFGRAVRTEAGFSFTVAQRHGPFEQAEWLEKATTPGGVVTFEPLKIASVFKSQSMAGVYYLTLA